MQRIPRRVRLRVARPTDYAATEEGEDQACDEWHHDHLQRLLDAEARKHIIRTETLLELARDLRQATKPSLPTEHAYSPNTAAAYSMPPTGIDALLDDRT